MSKEKESDEKKHIDNVSIFDGKQFEYDKMLGEGAFGIVRKCKLKEDPG